MDICPCIFLYIDVCVYKIRSVQYKVAKFCKKIWDAMQAFYTVV